MKIKKIIIPIVFINLLICPISRANSSTIPDINSRAAIVFDRTTSTVLYGKNENQIRKMASTTKIMTAIIVIENSNLYNTVTISKNAANVGGSTLGIKEGDQITVCDLLYGLLLKSGNDTAVALAEYVGGSVENFAILMNNKAKELSLTNTHFVTPHGLDDDNHYTTAYELALLTDYALKNQTFANFVETKSYTVTINGVPKTINNTNELLGSVNGIYGVKTGFTNGANRCLVSACKRDNLDVICIVLGADTKNFRTQDSIKLLNYTYQTFQMIDLKKLVDENFNKWVNENALKIKINKGVSDKQIQLKLKDFNYNYYPVKKENINTISTLINCNYNLQAPIPANTSIGNLKVTIDDNNVLNFDIVNTILIEKKNYLTYIQDFFTNYFRYLTTAF